MSKKDSQATPKKLNDVLELLVDQTYQILSWKITAAMAGATLDQPEGLPDGYSGFNHAQLDSIVELVKPLLPSIQEAKKIKVESIRDITEGLKKGKMTIKEAQDLIKMLENKKELEDDDDF